MSEPDAERAMAARSVCFVSTDWLAGNLDVVAIVDGSWHLPGSGRDAASEYQAAHIPGAVFFDIDAVADRDNPLPHMLPAPALFAEAVGRLGIDERQRIVVYDSVGLSSAPRVWWTFKVMGARDVVILEGGLPKWRNEGRPLESGATTPPERRFTARFDPATVCDMDAIRAGIGAGLQVVDARPEARFTGEAPEPRAWVKSGHIPGSFSLPSSALVADGGVLKDAASIRQAFADAGIDLARPIATSCGSGVNAALLNLALETIGIGVERTALYDGSWTEWGGRDDTEIATGQR